MTEVAVVTKTKKARTFIQERKKSRQVDSVIRNLANHVNANLRVLNKIIEHPDSDDKTKVEAIKVTFALYKDLTIARDRSEVERLENELKYREQLQAELKTEDNWEDDDSDEDDENTPFVDFSQVVPISE